MNSYEIIFVSYETMSFSYEMSAVSYEMRVDPYEKGDVSHDTEIRLSASMIVC